MHVKPRGCSPALCIDDQVKQAVLVATLQHRTQHSSARAQLQLQSQQQRSTAQPSAALHSTAQHSTAQHSTAQQEHTYSTAQAQLRHPSSPVPWLVSQLKSPLDSCYIIRQQAEGRVTLHELGLRNAGLGPGGQQVTPQDLRPGEAVLVDHPGPPPGPALTWALFTHLRNQGGVW